MGIDLAKMAATVHRFGVPLLVDEAHGSHYGFHPAFPQSAMESGADAAVQSTHKMTTALTMSSMLHVQGNRIDRERLARSLALLQSSSPSYLLMASLDLARRHLVMEAAQEWDELLPLLDELREAVREMSWLELAGIESTSVYSTMDPLKLMLMPRAADLDGFGLQQVLEDFRIYPELADTGHVLLAASSGTRPHGYRSTAACTDIDPGEARSSAKTHSATGNRLLQLFARAGDADPRGDGRPAGQCASGAVAGADSGRNDHSLPAGNSVVDPGREDR